MPKLISLLLAKLVCCALSAQHFSVANEKQNVFYIGVDNPLSIAVENVPDKMLVVKTDNGTVSKKDGTHIYRGAKIGRADIIFYKKLSGRLKEIGRSAFRVKSFPPPVFKIGAYGNMNAAMKIVLKSQQFVRAELENFDIDARFTIDSFKVCIISGDTCQYTLQTNISNKINDKLAAAFEALKIGETIIFKNIFAKGPDGNSIELEPCILFVKEE